MTLAFEVSTGLILQIACAYYRESMGCEYRENKYPPSVNMSQKLRSNDALHFHWINRHGTREQILKNNQSFF